MTNTGSDDEVRRVAFEQLSHLDELTTADEEEIGRFRSFATDPPADRGGHRFGRLFGGKGTPERRIA